MSLCFNITGMLFLTSAVTSAHIVPGPKAKGCKVSRLKGNPSTVMDFTWASSMISVSCPVKYPSFMLHSMHASRSPDIAASRRQNHLSINSLEYSLLAPKSTSSTCRVWVFHKKLVQFGSVCITRNPKALSNIIQ